ncbi:MAG: hypothetical protein ACI9CE_001325 [Flavobacterium sp.]|jgi:hypothetical protein
MPNPNGLLASEYYLPSQEEISQGDVEIIAGEDKTVYEYRLKGRLLLIKIVPNKGLSYYMIPTDGGAHYRDLDHSKSLYPSWILYEW